MPDYAPSSQLAAKCAALVRSEADPLFYKRHLLPVVFNALELARATGADRSVVEVAAWLHDVARLRSKQLKRGAHELKSAEEARKILKQFGAKPEFIERVADCIHHHVDGRQASNAEEKALVSADGLAHLENASWLLFIALRDNYSNDLESAEEWVRNKIEFAWKHKIVLRQAREKARQHYAAAIKILTPSH
ncbi:MAG: HD domain-containing protein [Candidatus Micrarchaeota archaeon]